MKLKLTFLFVLFFCISQAQNIYTIAGTGTTGFNGDGIAATTANIDSPIGIAVDTAGNTYFADYITNRVRKIDAVTGLISTIAGTGIGGYNGDNIPATSADLYYPHGIAIDKIGNIYITDKENNRIRMINKTTGLISTIAGTGVWGDQDSIAATSAMIAGPIGIALDTMGNVYFSETFSCYVKKIDATTGNLYTIAGTGVPGYNGNNISADTARLNDPAGLACDETGNVYIASAM